MHQTMGKCHLPTCRSIPSTVTILKRLLSFDCDFIRNDIFRKYDYEIIRNEQIILRFLGGNGAMVQWCDGEVGGRLRAEG